MNKQSAKSLKKIIFKRIFILESEVQRVRNIIRCL